MDIRAKLGYRKYGSGIASEIIPNAAIRKLFIPNSGKYYITLRKEFSFRQLKEADYTVEKLQKEIFK